MTTASGSYQVHSEERGPHWIAWIARGDSPKPEGAVVLVGETREVAERRAREWAERSSQ
jgi:hypothetical protein